MAQLIKFKKNREFGDHFNDTFNFLKQEYKPLGRVILYYVVPFMLLYALAMMFYTYKSQELVKSLGTNTNPSPFGAFSTSANLFGYLGLVLLVSIISSTMLFCTVYGYIKLYIKQSGEVLPTQVWAEIRKNFLNCFFASLLVALIIVLGMILCIIPGIYFGVALCLVQAIICLEDGGFGQAFSRSSKLVGTNWWGTFGTILVALIISYILMILVSIPGMLVGFKSLFTTMKNAGTPPNFSVFYYIMNTLTHLITHLISIILTVVLAFVYYSLVEKVERVSLQEKIDQINSNNTNL